MQANPAGQVIYILNLREQVAHRAFQLDGALLTSEPCNVDDIEDKERSDVIPAGYRRCQHCFEADG